MRRAWYRRTPLVSSRTRRRRAPRRFIFGHAGTDNRLPPIYSCQCGRPLVRFNLATLGGRLANFEITVTDVVSQQAGDAIGGGLNSYNDDVTGYADRRPLGVLVEHPATGEVLGGATGRSSLGLLFLDLFYLPEALRGQGIGTAVLRAFEEAGRHRGCVAGVLYTISFQAPEFYERHGWRRFGEIACAPPGTSRIFLTKQLQPLESLLAKSSSDARLRP